MAGAQTSTASEQARAQAFVELGFDTTQALMLAATRGEATSQAREMVRSDHGQPAGVEAARRPANLVFYSIYFDEVVKTDGVWRFARRTCRPIYIEEGGLTGQLCVTGPMPGGT